MLQITSAGYTFSDAAKAELATATHIILTVGIPVDADPAAGANFVALFEQEVSDLTPDDVQMISDILHSDDGIKAVASAIDARKGHTLPAAKEELQALATDIATTI